RLLQAVDQIAPDLPGPVVVQHGHTPFQPTNCKAEAFLTMSAFEHAIRTSELLIIHGGGGGILLALKSGKVPVMVPRRHELGEHIDNHQVSWSRALNDTERVVLVEDTAHLLDGARTALERQIARQAMHNDVPLIKMVRNALRAS
ncbi:MAG: glycosyltransferase, partial [Pseudomonadota bacterium]